MRFGWITLAVLTVLGASVGCTEDTDPSDSLDLPNVLFIMIDTL